MSVVLDSFAKTFQVLAQFTLPNGMPLLGFLLGLLLIHTLLNIFWFSFRKSDSKSGKSNSKRGK